MNPNGIIHRRALLDKPASILYVCMGQVNNDLDDKVRSGGKQ